jgi:hypothetical protein
VSWGAVVAHHVDAHGGWTALAHALAGHLAGVREAPADAATVEKGLRRLARRRTADGGQYGRWLLRFFGLPPAWMQFAAHLGQYHHRFADLPAGLRHAQLAMWDRPPIVGSPAEAWIHLGMASVLHRMGDVAACEARLARARARADRAGPMAVMELALLAARIATDLGDRATAEARFAEVERVLAGEAAALAPADRHPYAARVAGQRAYHLLHPAGGSGGAADAAGALALFAAIPADTGLPFVDFRRTEGEAMCRLALGESDRALALARLAAGYAADGGYVRLRILALDLAAKITGGAEGDALRTRARRLAAQLEDEDLLQRIGRAADPLLP